VEISHDQAAQLHLGRHRMQLAFCDPFLHRRDLAHAGVGQQFV